MFFNVRVFTYCRVAGGSTSIGSQRIDMEFAATILQEKHLWIADSSVYCVEKNVVSLVKFPRNDHRIGSSAGGGRCDEQ